MVDDDLEKLLRARVVPEMRSHLEHRIIAASREVTSLTQDVRRRGIAVIFSEIFDAIMIPRPVLSLAVVLVLGAFMGLYSGPIDGAMDNDMDVFFLVAEDIEYEEFL